jgi:hypothetical protein
MHEIEPFLLVLVEGARGECALWRLEHGETALAMFTTAQAATAYGDAAGLTGWQVFRPGREALLGVLAGYARAGVRLGVLDPDLSQAKRLFDLQAVVRAAGTPEGGANSPGGAVNPGRS